MDANVNPPLDVGIAGATVRFRTGHEALAAYARAHLATLRTTGGEREIESTLEWVEGLPPAEPEAIFPGARGLARIDRDIYRGQHSLLWLRIDDFRDLKLRFTMDGRTLRVAGRYYFHLSNQPARNALKRALYFSRLEAERRRRFTTLLYYLVYYPCLWWLERHRGIHPLHAGAVSTPRGAVLLAGLSGVGKSTLALALMGEPGVRFLSDTFVLYDRFRLYPLVEPILLDARSRGWLGPELTVPLREVAEPGRFGYGRRGYLMEPARCADSAAVGLALLPHRAPRTALVRLPLRESLARITACNEITRDIRRYWVFSAVLNLLHTDAMLNDRRGADLASLLTNVPCYEFGFEPGEGRAALVQRALALLPADGTDAHDVVFGARMSSRFPIAETGAGVEGSD